MKRRTFLTGLAGTLLGCDGGDRIPPPDITLTGSERSDMEAVRGLWDRLSGMARKGSGRVRIGLSEGRSSRVIRLELVKGGAASYPHCRVVREWDGRAINLVWGWKGLGPSITLAFDDGSQLVVNGQPVEVGMGDARGLEGRQALDLIGTGIKVAAIALAIWLGAQVGRGFLAAIAFVAFSIAVLGLLAAAVGVVLPAIEFILQRITWEDVQNFFRSAVEQFIQLFRDVRTLLEHLLG